MSEEIDGSFQIKWDGARYTVSIPNYPGGDVIAIEHYRALAKERDVLVEKVKNLTAWYDKMFGTPCEEIRHQQQVEALEEERNALAVRREALEEALTYMMEEKIGYMKVNHLGDPETQHSIKLARATLQGKES